MDFMGIHNVYEVKSVLGIDGMADGFYVYYKDDRSYNKGKRWIKKIVDCRRYVKVRDSQCENDGEIHGFGRGTMVKKSVSKKVQREADKNKALKRIGEALRGLERH